jgi:hypothetical protein
MMHRVPGVLAVAIAAAWLLSGCGPRPEAASATEPQGTLPGGGKAVEPAAPSVPWSGKSRAERMEFMGLVFHPRMKELFTPAVGKRADPFRCQTCHGENMVAVSYAMPNGLHPLPATNPYDAARAEDEETARFMADKVVPAARELLGEDVTCHTCHDRARGE